MQDQDTGNYTPVLNGAYAPVYKRIDSTKLHVNIFFPPNHEANDTLPCIVYFFGGAFIHGSPAQYESHCKYFAARGIVAIAADYRVIARNNCTALECVNDAKSCIRWLRDNADTLGIHPNKIIMAGGSAGGFLCLAAAIDNPTFQDSTDNLTISSVPNAMVLLNPVINSEEFDFRIKKFPGKAAEINPLTHIKKGMPPAIIFHGTKDEMSGYQYAKQFTEASKNAGNSVELITFEGLEHGFMQRNKHDGKYYEETLHLTDAWLVKQGFLR